MRSGHDPTPAGDGMPARAVSDMREAIATYAHRFGDPARNPATLQLRLWSAMRAHLVLAANGRLDQ